MSNQSLQWWSKCFGRSLWAAEQASVQDMLTDSSMRHILHVGPLSFDDLGAGVDLTYYPCDVFLAEMASPVVWSGCYDLVILSHVLEFSVDPQRLLYWLTLHMCSEATLLIFGFNPYSYVGLVRYCRRLFVSKQYPGSGDFLALSKLFPLLSQVGFHPLYGHYLAYHGPVGDARCRNCLNAMGDRWWPGLASVYAVMSRLGRRVSFPPQSAQRSAVTGLGACL